MKQRAEDLKKIHEKEAKTPFYVYIFLLLHLWRFLQMYCGESYLSFAVHMVGFFTMQRRLYTRHVPMGVQVLFSIGCFIVTYQFLDKQ